MSNHLYEKTKKWFHAPNKALKNVRQRFIACWSVSNTGLRNMPYNLRTDGSDGLQPDEFLQLTQMNHRNEKMNSN